MGGYGSTRWGNYRKKLTVDQCLVLDIAYLTRRELIKPYHYIQDRIPFFDVLTEEYRGEIDIEVNTKDLTGSYIRLSYLIAKTGKNVNSTIELESMPNTYGGFQWWFICPLTTNNGFCCFKRVRKLYLPPGEIYFGCRHCYNLTYLSSQKSHVQPYGGAYALLKKMA